MGVGVGSGFGWLFFVVGPALGARGVGSSEKRVVWSSVSERGEEGSAGTETAPCGVEKRMCGMASFRCGGVMSQEALGVGCWREMGKAREVVCLPEAEVEMPFDVALREFVFDEVVAPFLEEGKEEWGIETTSGSGKSSDQT